MRHNLHVLETNKRYQRFKNFMTCFNEKMTVHRNILVRLIYDEDRARRLRLLRSAEGLFKYHEEYFVNDFDEDWALCKRPCPGFSSEEAAIRDARQSINWLRHRLHDLEYEH